MTRGTHQLPESKTSKDHQDHAGQPPPSLCKPKPNSFWCQRCQTRQLCFSETYLSLLKSAVFCDEVLPCLITFTVRKLLLIQIRLNLLNSVSLLLDIVTLLSTSLKVCCPRRVQLSQSFTDQNPVFDVAGT